MDYGLIFGMGVEIRVGGSRDDLVYILLVACSLQPVVLGGGASRRDEGWRRGGMINAHIWVSGGISTSVTPCSASQLVGTLVPYSYPAGILSCLAYPKGEDQ